MPISPRREKSSRVSDIGASNPIPGNRVEDAHLGVRHAAAPAVEITLGVVLDEGRVFLDWWLPIEALFDGPVDVDVVRGIIVSNVPLGLSLL